MARCLEATGLTGGVPLHRSPVGPAARGHSWARSSTTRWDGLFSPAKGHQSRQWVDRPPGCQAAGGGRQAPCPASRTLSLARHCTASSGDRRFRAPAICSLGGVEAGLGPERKWRRRQGAAGRPRVGRPARGPPREAAGGRPSCGVRVRACARVHTRSPACRAGRPGRVGRPRGPSGTWRGRGVERPVQTPRAPPDRAPGEGDHHHKASVLSSGNGAHRSGQTREGTACLQGRWVFRTVASWEDTRGPGSQGRYLPFPASVPHP